MARTSVEISQQEIQVLQEFFNEHPELDTANNGEKIFQYIVETWQEQVTPYTLGVAVQKLTEARQIEVLSPAAITYFKISRQEDPARVKALSDWFENQQIIVKDDDLGFQNATALLLELRGRDITQRSIQEAVGRVGHRNGLHYVPVKRRPDPRQHTLRPGESFMSKSETNLSARDHARKAEARGETTPAPAKPAEKDTWQEICERMLRHGTHGCQAAMAEAFNRRGDKSWRQLYSDLEKIARSYERLVNPRAV